MEEAKQILATEDWVLPAVGISVAILVLAGASAFAYIYRDIYFGNSARSNGSKKSCPVCKKCTDCPKDCTPKNCNCPDCHKSKQ